MIVHIVYCTHVPSWEAEWSWLYPALCSASHMPSYRVCLSIRGREPLFLTDVQSSSNALSYVILAGLLRPFLQLYILQTDIIQNLGASIKSLFLVFVTSLWISQDDTNGNFKSLFSCPHSVLLLAVTQLSLVWELWFPRNEEKSSQLPSDFWISRTSLSTQLNSSPWEEMS